MKENPNIDELLNSFIDGELTQRQFTEVQRLITHDEQIARRLRELQKCKILVSSLPSAEAPAWLADEIKTTLERRTLLGPPKRHYEEIQGARHLLIRNVLSAAAMIGLITVLAAVIYTILAPEGVEDKPFVFEDWGQPTREIVAAKPELSVAKDIEIERPQPSIAAVAGTKGAENGVPVVSVEESVRFNMRLELETGGLPAVSAFISKAIGDNGLFEREAQAYQNEGGRYAFSCSREVMGLFLADLENVWDKFESAKLFVETGEEGDEVVIEGVTVKQIDEIINKDGFEKGIEVARDFAVLNNMHKLLPGKEIYASIDADTSDLSIIPKPVLTSGNEAIQRAREEIDESQKVHLTILIIGG
jgi:hypothetical protein